MTEVFGSSGLSVKAGATFINKISGSDNATVEILGGDVILVDLLGQSRGTISGGTFACNGRCVGLFGSAQASILDGEFGNNGGISILAQENSSATLRGGTFLGAIRAANDSAIEIRGGNLSEVTATEQSLLTLYGTNFIAEDTGGNLVLTGYGDLPSGFHGQISGTLADGTTLDVSGLNGVTGSRIVLAELEPTVTPGYASVANAQASSGGEKVLSASAATNILLFLLLPAGTVFLLKARRAMAHRRRKVAFR